MNTINETYVNALLADASYVALSRNGQVVTSSVILANISARMTAPQATFITTNFEVLNQELSDTGVFDATVWRGRTGTAYAGKVYVSMRGKQQGQDFADYGDLALSGVAYKQFVSMANWCNKQDNTNGLVYDVAAPAGQVTLFQWYGAQLLASQSQLGLATLAPCGHTRSSKHTKNRGQVLQSNILFS